MLNRQYSNFPLIDIGGGGGGGGGSSRANSLFHLPPGCGFYPSDDELLKHYLTGKNSSLPADRADAYGYDLIGELNLYDYEPSDLPKGACFVHGYRGRKRHWFCYTESKGGRGRRRRAKGGFWWKIGKVRDVFDGGSAALGTRTKFVFYEVDSVKAAVRTPWIMYEYALLHHPKATFVLCRVFARSRARNSVSENVLSCAEDTVSVLPHIGIQRDEFLRPDTLEADFNGDDFNKELDDPIATGPVSVASFEFPSVIPAYMSNDLVGSRLTTNELLSIIEEDFIELDDLS